MRFFVQKNICKFRVIFQIMKRFLIEFKKKVLFF